MRRTSLKNEKCPVARSLDVVGDWWTLLIVRDALKGARRFNEFQKSLGCAKNILSTRLRAMVEAGILEVRDASDGGTHSEYHLTRSGEQLQVVLVALRQWGEQNLFGHGEPMMVAVDAKNKQRLPRLQLTTTDGRGLGPAEIQVEEGSAVVETASTHARNDAAGATPKNLAASKRHVRSSKVS
jgi:DNA-binding HxlR family transcriptional regulator